MAGRAYQGIYLNLIVDKPTRDALSAIDVYLRDQRGQEEAAGGGGGGGLPDEPYITISNTANLTNERALAVQAPVTKSDGGANAAITLGVTLAVPAFTYGTPAAGSADSLVRSDAVLPFPQALKSTANGFTLTLTDDATNVSLTSNLGSLLLEAPNAVDINRGLTSTGATISTTRGSPADGARTLWLANWINSGTLSSAILRCVDPSLNLSGIWTSVEFYGLSNSVFSLTASATSGAGNIAFAGRLKGPIIAGSNGSWTEGGTLYLERIRRTAGGVPTVPTGYNIKLEMPNIGQTDQMGIDIFDVADGSQHTPTNRYGIRIGKMVKGTNRVGVEIDADTGAVAGVHLRFLDKAGDPPAPTAGDIWRNADILKWRTSANTREFVMLAGQLGGTGDVPDVRGVRETGGPTLLTMGAVADGQFLIRSGSTIIGSAGSGSSSFADNLFDVHDDADATKIMKVECSGITTGTTRTLTIPNKNGTIMLDLVDDTSPQLGGDLDVNGSGIVGIADLFLTSGATDAAADAIAEFIDIGGMGTRDYFQFANNKSGGGIIQIAALGADANINIAIVPKGSSGSVNATAHTVNLGDVALAGTKRLTYLNSSSTINLEATPSVGGTLTLPDDTTASVAPLTGHLLGRAVGATGDKTHSHLRVVAAMRWS